MLRENYIKNFSKKREKSQEILRDFLEAEKYTLGRTAEETESIIDSFIKKRKENVNVPET